MCRQHGGDGTGRPGRNSARPPRASDKAANFRGPTIERSDSYFLKASFQPNQSSVATSRSASFGEKYPSDSIAAHDTNDGPRARILRPLGDGRTDLGLAQGGCDLFVGVAGFAHGANLLALGWGSPLFLGTLGIRSWE